MYLFMLEKYFMYLFMLEKYNYILIVYIKASKQNFVIYNIK
jgi:hypothetical protein